MPHCMESNPQALPARLAPKHESNQLIKATRASETGWKFRLVIRETTYTMEETIPIILEAFLFEDLP